MKKKEREGKMKIKLVACNWFQTVGMVSVGACLHGNTPLLDINIERPKRELCNFRLWESENIPIISQFSDYYWKFWFHRPNVFQLKYGCHFQLGSVRCFLWNCGIDFIIWSNNLYQQAFLDRTETLFSLISICKVIQKGTAVTHCYYLNWTIFFSDAERCGI